MLPRNASRSSSTRHLSFTFLETPTPGGLDPAWRFVPNTQREEDPLDPGPEPWSIEDMEAAVRQGIEDAVTRKQERSEARAPRGRGAARAILLPVAHPAAR
jgi:hypothetical protein